MPLRGGRRCSAVWGSRQNNNSRATGLRWTISVPQAALAKIELSSALRGHSTTMYGRLLQATRTATCKIYRSRRWCSRGVASGSSGDGRTLDVARLDGGLKGAETLTVPSGRFPGSPVWAAVGVPPCD